MQIINGDIYLKNLSSNIVKKINITAPRGIIYDRYGRILAGNKFVYNIKLDPSIKVDNLNKIISNVIKLLEQNNDLYIDDLPISKDTTPKFLFKSNLEKIHWQKDMNINKNLDANQTLEYLKSFFDITDEFDSDEVRKIIALRSKVYLQRYRQYKPITLAVNVSQNTVIAIEENNKEYVSVYIESEPIREYEDAECFSNLLGYVGNITEQELKSDSNYQSSDVVGKSGLERAFEKNLCGKEGELLIQVDNTGRRVGVAERTNAIPGNDLFLTIDKELQKKSYQRLENILSDILRLKLQKGTLDIQNLFASMLYTNALSIQNIFEAEENSYSYKIKSFVLNKNPKLNYLSSDDQKKIRDIISDNIKNKSISLRNVLLLMYEQNIISGDINYILDNSVSKIFYDKLSSKEILPKLFNFDPCTGSIVVLDSETGEVLVAVSYPSYDNNKLNNEHNYYNQIATAVNTPMVNRPFMEPRAPGSTFKMITALTGLENEVITKDTLINDELIFKKAGVPYSKCWAKHSHGMMNVSTALEVSCNYFFFETAYRLGNNKNNNSLDSIRKLNYFMRAFGLDERTGVEIGELYDFSDKNICHISAPEYKKDKNTKEKLIWYDGDTIRTAIGQSKNNYTAANMAKYINTLASAGKRYKLYLVDYIKNIDGDVIYKNSPVVEEELNIKEEYIDAIYKGMLLVNEGKHGTGHNVFVNFPIRVAGKTGTAQESNLRPDHTSYGGFAPFNNPRISVYVLIPFGDTKLTLAPSAQIAKDIISEYFKLEANKNIIASTECLTE
jgi:cell division protein FtsI/penicillin-binding protein 2